MSARRSSLPGILGEIADIIGTDAAYRVAVARGGIRADFPARAYPDHWLTDCLGLELADRLCRALSIQDADGRTKGVRHEIIPLATASLQKTARRHVAKALDAGSSVRTAARSAGVHERTAWRIKAELGRDDDGDQGELFRRS